MNIFGVEVDLFGSITFTSQFSVRLSGRPGLQNVLLCNMANSAFPGVVSEKGIYGDKSAISCTNKLVQLFGAIIFFLLKSI